jgi:GTP-binding protein Era
VVTEGTRSGFVGLAGRPNVGKSTLINAIVGAKVAIVAERPQTTRRAIRGIATDAAAGSQLVLIDLPGVQRPRDALTQRMQSRVERELTDADAVLLVISALEGVGPGDRFIANTLLRANQLTASREERAPVICAVNKIDRVDKGQVASVLEAAAALRVVDEVFPVSAKEGTGLAPLAERLAELMPEGPYLYPPEERSDLPSDVLLAELIREQVLRRTREELPHAVEVSVQEVERREDGLVTVKAQIWVESESQRGILVGRGGRMVRDIGKGARKELERELGAHVYLDLTVQARGRWRGDDSLLDRLGIE